MEHLTIMIVIASMLTMILINVYHVLLIGKYTIRASVCILAIAICDDR